MKNILIITFILSFALVLPAKAQFVNWRALDSDGRHLVSANFGADYSFYYGISYGYILNGNTNPIVLGVDFSLPFGEDAFDDWVWNTSLKTELWRRNNLSLSGKAGLLFRSYQSPLARMKNIGGDFAITFGLVKSKWGISLLTAYEGSFATKITHTGLTDYFHEIHDGWFGSSGGNFKFGAVSHLNFGSWNTFLSVGKHFGQDFSDNPTFPFFFEIKLQNQLKKSKKLVER